MADVKAVFDTNVLIDHLGGEDFTRTALVRHAGIYLAIGDFRMDHDITAFGNHVVALMERFGLLLVPNQKTSEIVTQFFVQGNSSVVTAIAFAGNQMADDYLSGEMTRLVRSAETAAIISSTLKVMLEKNEITTAEHAVGTSVAAPFLQPGPKTMAHAREVFAMFGDECFAVCVREKSEKMSEAQRIVEDAYVDHLARPENKRPRIMNWLFR